MCYTVAKVPTEKLLVRNVRHVNELFSSTSHEGDLSRRTNCAFCSAQLITAFWWHRLVVQLVSLIESHRLSPEERRSRTNWLQIHVFSVKVSF